MLDAEAVFFSVGGIEDTISHEFFVQRESIYFNSYLLRKLYEELKKEGNASQFVGEILGQMLDENGEICGSPAFQELNLISVYTLLDIHDLKALARSSSITKVWIVAAGSHKRVATLMAIKNGLADSLAIDSQIADYLIEKA